MSIFSFNDFLLVASTLAGPVLAVQAQKWVESVRETRTRQLRIFETLMATRAMQVAPERVQALNSIELAFRGRSSKRIIDAYRLYFDKLNEQLGINPEMPTIERWNERCTELSVDLLFEMSEMLRFDFDKVQLRRGAYYPRLHAETEVNAHLLRDAALNFLTGKQSIAMRVTEFPVTPEAAETQLQLQRRMAAALCEDGSLRVTLKPGS